MEQLLCGILGGKDETLLGIYSHMIDYPLYLPNYPMGHLIAFQIEQQVRGKNLADEMNRMYTQGSIIPQLWIKTLSVHLFPLIRCLPQPMRHCRR